MLKIKNAYDLVSAFLVVSQIVAIRRLPLHPRSQGIADRSMMGFWTLIWHWVNRCHTCQAQRIVCNYEIVKKYSNKLCCTIMHRFQLLISLVWTVNDGPRIIALTHSWKYVTSVAVMAFCCMHTYCMFCMEYGTVEKPIGLTGGNNLGPPMAQNSSWQYCWEIPGCVIDSWFFYRSAWTMG